MIYTTINLYSSERRQLSVLAIMIPLVQVNEEWHVLFEVRSLTMRKQPGDISFPGGRIDPTDNSPLEAAIRETHEELGIDPASINVLGQMSAYIASSSFVVYPFVAIIDHHEIYPFNKQRGRRNIHYTGQMAAETRALYAYNIGSTDAFNQFPL